MGWNYLQCKLLNFICCNILGCSEVSTSFSCFFLLSLFSVWPVLYFFWIIWRWQTLLKISERIIGLIVFCLKFLCFSCISKYQPGTFDEWFSCLYLQRYFDIYLKNAEHHGTETLVKEYGCKTFVNS